MRRVYLVVDTKRILQDDRMFDLVHLVQEEGWRLKGDAIATYTNPFCTQRE